MSYQNRGKRQFTEREKRAYSAGRGYAAAKAGRRVKCETEKEKRSFRNGVNAVRGKKVKKVQGKHKGGGTVRKAECVIDADGVIQKIIL